MGEHKSAYDLSSISINRRKKHHNYEFRPSNTPYFTGTFVPVSSGQNDARVSAYDLSKRGPPSKIVTVAKIKENANPYDTNSVQIIRVRRFHGGLEERLD